MLRILVVGVLLNGCFSVKQFEYDIRDAFHSPESFVLKKRGHESKRRYWYFGVQYCEARSIEE